MVKYIEPVVEYLHFFLKEINFTHVKEYNDLTTNPEKKYYFLESRRVGLPEITIACNKEIAPILIGELKTKSEGQLIGTPKENNKKETTRITFIVKSIEVLYRKIDTSTNNRRITIKPLTIKLVRNLFKEAGVPVTDTRRQSNSKGDWQHFTFETDVEAKKAIDAFQKIYPTITKQQLGKHVQIAENFFEKKQRNGTGGKHQLQLPADVLPETLKEMTGEQLITAGVEKMRKDIQKEMEIKNHIISKLFKELRIPFSKIGKEFTVNEQGELVIPIETSLKFIK